MTIQKANRIEKSHHEKEKNRGWLKVLPFGAEQSQRHKPDLEKKE